MSEPKNNKSSMLDMVKAVKPARRTKQHVGDADRMELSIAFLQGAITHKQVAAIVWPNKLPTSTITMFYCLINHGLRDAFKAGIIKIVRKP